MLATSYESWRLGLDSYDVPEAPARRSGRRRGRPRRLARRTGRRSPSRTSVSSGPVEPLLGPAAAVDLGDERPVDGVAPGAAGVEDGVLRRVVLDGPRELVGELARSPATAGPRRRARSRGDGRRRSGARGPRSPGWPWPSTTLRSWGAVVTCSSNGGRGVGARAPTREHHAELQADGRARQGLLGPGRAASRLLRRRQASGRPPPGRRCRCASGRHPPSISEPCGYTPTRRHRGSRGDLAVSDTRYRAAEGSTSAKVRRGERQAHAGQADQVASGPNRPSSWVPTQRSDDRGEAPAGAERREVRAAGVLRGDRRDEGVDATQQHQVADAPDDRGDDVRRQAGRQSRQQQPRRQDHVPDRQGGRVVEAAPPGECEQGLPEDDGRGRHREQQADDVDAAGRGR